MSAKKKQTSKDPMQIIFDYGRLAASFRGDFIVELLHEAGFHSAASLVRDYNRKADVPCARLAGKSKKVTK